MKNIVILISGRGSNMEAIVQACATEGWPARVAAVISSRHDAAGLQFARSRGIATVHFVTAELDHGPIIAQVVVPVLPGDSEATLSARVLAREHVLYPRAVRWLINGMLRVENGIVTHTSGEPQLI
jgi:folate-dependent phosphoribosylglycinamide formyltransferase PurN